ncbi:MULTISPECIES: DUF4190 domain-containing protein [unclassified Spirillospora]|uniref:DUF4190 domain-containing protein n=1 Tax=unclassified Spirillospora TaxID=2642701 RepID=UPI003722D38E
MSPGSGYGPPPMPAGPGYGPPMPGGPDYGAPYGPRSDKTSGLAIAAFVTGLLGCLGILGIILGIIALREITRSGARGRGLAVAGIVLSCLWLVAGIASFALRSAVTGSSSGDLGSPPGTSEPESKEVDAKRMKVGDCINDDQGATNAPVDGEPVEVDSVKIVSCKGPHDGEVVAIFQLPGSITPTDQQMNTLASSGCRPRMRSKLSRDPAARSLATSYYYPTTESWRQGDRDVTCVAVSANEGTKLTRPLRS